MHRKHLVLIIDSIAVLAFNLVNLSYPPVSKLVADQFGLSYAQSGLVTSVYFIPYAAMQVPGGYLADRFGSARILFVSCLVMSLAPIVFILGNSYDAALISRIVAGASGGIVFPSGVRLLSSWFHKDELDRAMSYFGSGFGVAQLTAAFVLPLLIADTNWRPPLVFTVIFSLAASLLVIAPVNWAKNEIRGSDGGSVVKVRIRGVFTRNMFALMFPNFASLAITFGVFAWALIFLTSTLNMAYTTAGAVLASLGLATMAGAYSGAMFNRRFGKRKTTMLSMLITIVFTGLLGVSSSAILAAACIFGIGFGANLYFAAVFSLIPYASKQGVAAAGLTFGVFNSLSNVGSFIGPILFGVILDASGSFVLGFAALALVAVSGLVGAALITLE